jgi:DNA-binding MarR family transcriptional regulator
LTRARFTSNLVSIETNVKGEMAGMRRRRGAAAEAEGAAAGRLALERFVPYRLSVLANTVSRDVARIYDARFGLSVPEWRVMAVLGRFEPLAANAVAARTAMDKVRVSRAVARLLRAGLVARATDRHDRRRSVLRLSARGLAIYAAIVPLALAVEAKLLAALRPAERAALDRLLAKLQARAERLAAGGGGPD